MGKDNRVLNQVLVEKINTPIHVSPENLARSQAACSPEVRHALPKTATPSPTSEAKVPTSEMIRYAFMLRPGMLVELSLPANLTIADVTRFTAFLQLLPSSDE